MKKLIFLLVLCSGVSPLWSQQGNEPVYVNIWFLGDYICEYATNGAKDEDIKSLESFITNGRMYFVCKGMAVTDGYLKTGSKIIISENYKITGIYQGIQKDHVNSTDIFVVSGFAEPGKITITNIFLDDQSYGKWADTVKFAE
jgi:hypothetical protein